MVGDPRRARAAWPARSASFAQIAHHQHDPGPYVGGVGIALILAGILLLAGCFVIGPNEARVLTFFGRYTGTVRDTGLRWANPFTTKRVDLAARAQLRDREDQGQRHRRQPDRDRRRSIVWRVVDTAQAMFEVESFTSFVQMQAEAAMRNLAMHHPYDATTTR